MERVVQKNKANGQMFITIPKFSGISENDTVHISHKNNLAQLANNLYHIKKGDTTSIETEDRLIIIKCEDEFKKTKA